MINKNLKRIRTNNKLSINKLATLSGINKSTISEIESNKILNPSTNTLIKLSEALGCSLDYLMGKSVKAVVEDKLDELNMTFKDLSCSTSIPMNFFDWLEDLQRAEPYLIKETIDISDYRHCR